MLPKTHFITSLIFTVLLWPIFGFNSLWIMVGGFLIDFDHYLYSIFTRKDYSLKNSYLFHKNREFSKYKNEETLHIFHTVEFWILLALGSFLFKFILLVMLGVLLHVTLDFYNLYIQRKYYHSRAISTIRWLKRNKHT